MTEALGGLVQTPHPGGKVNGPVPDLPAARLLDLYRWMVLGRTFSDKMIALQRQGRMGTFGSLNGMEACHAAMGFALEQQDWLVPTYRDIITMLIKGVPMLAIMRVYQGQVGNLYPREANTLPLQIVLATQLPHAAGLAMAAKLRGDKAAVLGICGDGASSEGDFHEALNFAGVYRAPVVFCVVNNQWAISVPRHKQTAAESIAQRAAGYGFPGVQVDGNDVLACYQVVRTALERARAGEGPTLIEFLTYRMGAHTTADDPKRYVPAADLEAWRQKDPITRFRRYLAQRNLLNDAAAEGVQTEAEAEVNAAVAQLEAMERTQPESVFDSVYAEPTPLLREQRDEMGRLIREMR